MQTLAPWVELFTTVGQDRCKVGNEKHWSTQMFPLSCARVRAHTSRKTSAHKKTWSAQNIFPKMFVHIHRVNNQDSAK